MQMQNVTLSTDAHSVTESHISASRHVVSA